MIRRFRQLKGRTAKPMLWEVEVAGNSVIVTWGQEDGAQQKTIQRFKSVNQGKANEKTPERVALEYAEREVLKHTRQGYRELDENGEFIGEKAFDVMDFDSPPLNFRTYKPQNTVNGYIQKLLDQNAAWCVRKRNGLMHYVFSGAKRDLRLFSSKVLPNHKDEPGIPWFDRYPHLYEAFLRAKLPPNSLILGEMVTQDEDEDGFQIDKFSLVNGVAKSLTPRALELQAGTKALGFCVWDVAFWHGENLLETTAYKKRYFDYNISKVLNPAGKPLQAPEIMWYSQADRQIEILHPYNGLMVLDNFQSLQIAAMTLAKDKRWEGWVVVDPDAVYGERGTSFHGKHERPKEACKMKPYLEADFIVRFDPDRKIGEWGKGKGSGKVGSVLCYLWDGVQEVEIGKCGGGMSDEQRAKLADPSLYPQVWRIEFESWTHKGSFRHPELSQDGIRDDKDPCECTMDQRPPLEDLEE